MSSKKFVFKKKDATQGQRQFEARKQEREKERLLSAEKGVINDIDIISPKNWSKIKATHIDSQCRRYKFGVEKDNKMWCWVKLPSSEMILQGCSSCSGPHSVTNSKCWANSRSKSAQAIPHNALMDMETGELHPSRFVFDRVHWNEGRNELHRAGRIIIAKEK